MLETYKQRLIDSLSGVFDRIEDSFERTNIISHLNETVAYVEVNGYVARNIRHDDSGNGYRVYEAVYKLTALGARSMTAEELTGLMDNEVLSAIGDVDMNILSVTRHPCEYSKEQGRYRVALDIKVGIDLPSETNVREVTINNAQWKIFTDVTVKNSVKLYKLGLVNGSVASGMARNEPKTVALRANMSLDAAMGLYYTFSLQKGTVNSVTIDGITFGMMLLSSVSCDISQRGAVVTVEFCEVSA